MPQMPKMPRALPPLLLLLLLVASVILAACGGGGPASKGAPVASAPAEGARGAVVELRRWKNPQEIVRIGRGGVAMGPAGEPLAQKLFTRPERLEDVLHLSRTYAPFRAPSPRGELIFRGRGKAQAGPVERRMIREWARLVAAEAVAGRDGAAYGLFLAWHRGGPAGSCDDVTLFLTGEARASSCSWESEVRGRLAPEQLARLYGWFDRLKPFQSGGEEIGQIGSAQSRLIFAGEGSREPTREEMAELEALALALHRELAARRPASTARADAAVAPELERTAPGAAPKPRTAPARLLLPARPTAPTGSPRPVAVQIPAEPPLKALEAIEAPPPPPAARRSRPRPAAPEALPAPEALAPDILPPP
jgi:hypothetical protein